MDLHADGQGTGGAGGDAGRARVVRSLGAAPGTQTRSRNVALHILPTAATMVGACMTVISIAKLSPPNSVRHLADRLLGFDALMFLASVLLSYASLRARRWAGRLEGCADLVFLCGMSLMAIIGIIVAFEVL